MFCVGVESEGLWHFTVSCFMAFLRFILRTMPCIMYGWRFDSRITTEVDDSSRRNVRRL